MSDPRRPRGPGIAPPKAIGVNVSGDSTVRKYTAGIAARAKAAGNAARGDVQVPDLAAATSQYRPGKDAPMTLSQIAQAQENIKTMDPEQQKPGLKPETVAGLRALHEATAAQQQPAPTTPPTEKSEEKPPEKKSVTKLSEDEKRAAAETADLDFDVMLARMRNDIINNEEERKAVEARLKPMDLTDGLLTGEFKQHVPISPGKLEVGFRTISPLENGEMRKHILQVIIEDERFSNMAGEELAFMQMVASVHMLNGQEMPSHLKKGDKLTIRIFDWDAFNQKLALFRTYPTPLIHALSTHAHWFDLRVRKLFSSADLKNG